MRAWSAHYETLSSQMRNFEVFIVGTAMCSCDLFNRDSEENVYRGSEENVYEKYRKKGWSQAKIERAIANRKKANLHAGLHPELRRWLADAATEAGEAYLFIHWDSDELKYEQQVSMSSEEMREHTVPVKEEQLIHVKRE
jgi:hypothetical protein